jgi:hypothetical protein
VRNRLPNSDRLINVSLYRVDDVLEKHLTPQTIEIWLHNVAVPAYGASSTTAIAYLCVLALATRTDVLGNPLKKLVHPGRSHDLAEPIIVYITQVVIIVTGELPTGVYVSGGSDRYDLKVASSPEIATVDGTCNDIANDDAKGINHDFGVGVVIPHVKNLDHLLPKYFRRDSYFFIVLYGLSVELDWIDAQVYLCVVEEAIDLRHGFFVHSIEYSNRAHGNAFGFQ